MRDDEAKSSNQGLGIHQGWEGVRRPFRGLTREATHASLRDVQGWITLALVMCRLNELTTQREQRWQEMDRLARRRLRRSRRW